ncbi:MAG: SIR2 family NAD-dependent protein deacylase [Mycobacterium leprae]
MDAIGELAERWLAARSVVVLTGAGASTDSGLPDFRSKTGLWQGTDPMKLVSMTALRQRPVDFYQFYRFRLSKLRGAKPSGVHTALARLQQTGHVAALITQNIDGLHQAAGAADVIEMHGNLRESVCLSCEGRFSSDLIDVDVQSPADIPRCPKCGGVLKPAVVLFEEALPAAAVAKAFAATEAADLFVVIGSSLEVAPVNQMPLVAAMGGADLAIINLDPTPFDEWAHWLIRDRAALALDRCIRTMGL